MYVYTVKIVYLNFCNTIIIHIFLPGTGCRNVKGEKPLLTNLQAVE